MRWEQIVRSLAGLTLGCALTLAGGVCGAETGSGTTTPVTFQWDANPPTENVVAYRLWKCPAGQAPVGCVQMAETTATQVTLNLSYTAQCFRATAINALGQMSDFSNEACVDVSKPSKVNAFRVVVYVPAPK